MDEDKYALVEKIMKDIDNVLLKNAELHGFDVVPAEINFRNKSPVLYSESFLGLESWCVKHVYLYCYSELMKKYFYKTGKPLKLSSLTCERLSKLLNVTLLLNPDLNTLWNRRRDMIVQGFLDRSSELRFTRIVLSRKPKCNDVYSYRRWLLDPVFIDDSLQSNYIENLINEELHICELASEKSPNNYHSWNHRMWLINRMKTLDRITNNYFLYIKEYGFSERWTSKHVSDFSCFHYRQLCIKNILHINDESWKIFESNLERNIRKVFIKILANNIPEDLVTVPEETLLAYSEENLVNLLLGYSQKHCDCPVNYVYLCRKLHVLFYELLLNNELLQFYKFHETLWYHRRFVVHEIISVIYDYYSLVRHNGSLTKNICKKCNVDDLRQKSAKIVRYDCNKVYSSMLFKILLYHEKAFIEDRRNDNDNYADRHEKYLKFIEGLNSVV